MDGLTFVTPRSSYSIKYLLNIYTTETHWACLQQCKLSWLIPLKAYWPFRQIKCSTKQNVGCYHNNQKLKHNVDRINSISHWQCLCVCERYKNWSLPDSHLDISNSQCVVRLHQCQCRICISIWSYPWLIETIP